MKCLVHVAEKRDKSLKGRACADERVQRNYIGKELSSSPTVSTEALLLSCLIDTYECRDVATVNLPGAFLQTEMDDLVYIRLRGDVALQLVKTNPKKYKQFLKYNSRNKPYIIARLAKVLYGTQKASKLFYEDMIGFFVGQGFTINPYDHCVANKMVKGKQLTFAWHVDDLKISHVDPAVVGGLIEELNKGYGTVKRLSETRGPIHDYLGMILDFSPSRKVKIDMRDYLELTNPDLRSKGNRVTTPVTDMLFKVSTSTESLDKKKSEEFHSLTAKLLFLAKRSRPDILTAVTFLITRVQAPTMEDCGETWPGNVLFA